MLLQIIIVGLMLSQSTSTQNILYEASLSSMLMDKQFSGNNQQLQTDYLRIEHKNSSGKPECNCGHRKESEHRIVGGGPAGLHEFPWRCALYLQDRSKQLRFFCGCSVISQKWAMTAAHCTNFLTKTTKLFVNVGDHDLSTASETKNEFVEVTTIKQHEKYNKRTVDNDISLLRLGSPLSFNSNVAPVCLPFKFVKKKFESTMVTASGWGLEKEGSRDKTGVLRKVDLRVISNQLCKRHYRGSTISNNMLCTLSTGKDACQGDSGSSADFLDAGTNRSYAVGVVSFGRGCGRRNSPGVFTRVTQMLSWIKTNTGEKFCEE